MAWSFFTSTGVQKKLQTSAKASKQAGIITSFAGSSAPTGWLLCQGQQVSRATYPELAKALGATYGSFTDGSGGSGITHFRLPDLRGRAVAGVYKGAGDGSVGTSNVTGSEIGPAPVGFWQGAESVTLSGEESGIVSHSHSWSGGNHNHTMTVSSSHSHNNGPNCISVFYGDQGGGTAYTAEANNSALTSTSVGSFTTDSATSGITINNATSTPASSSHNNMQSSLVINFIIKT